MSDPVDLDARFAEANRRIEAIDRRLRRLRRLEERRERVALWRSFWRGFTHPFGRRR